MLSNVITRTTRTRRKQSVKLETPSQTEKRKGRKKMRKMLHAPLTFARKRLRRPL